MSTHVIIHDGPVILIETEDIDFSELRAAVEELAANNAIEINETE